MKYSVTLLLGLTHIGSLINAASLPANRDDIDDDKRSKRSFNEVDEYLQKFGYMKKFPDSGTESAPRAVPYFDVDIRSEAIRHFQEFNGLAVTGEINTETIEKMKEPRCGFPDTGTDSSAPQEFNARGNKWDSNNLLWKISKYGGKMSEGIQNLAMRNALKHWSDVTPLQFIETNQDANVDIRFETGSHGDGIQNAFDGKGGILAHAFFPESGFYSGDTHFDESERWVYHSNSGTELETVATHEFGHALGLGHSTNPRALMAPYYRSYNPEMMLHNDDIAGIQSLYGGKPTETKSTTPSTTTTTTKAPPTPIPTTTTTATSPSADMCDVPNFDAISSGPDGSTYVFKGEFVFKVDSTGLAPGFPKFTSDLYKGVQDAPLHLKAAFYNKETGETFMFNHHGKIWRYKGFQLQSVSVFDDFDFNAVITNTNRYNRQRIYMFGTDQFKEFITAHGDTSSWSAKISNYWRGIPVNSVAAIERPDKSLYFFTKNKTYVRINPLTRSVSLDKPDIETERWLKALCVVQDV